MIDKVILQIPMPKTLKMSAEEVARDYGFSSLQEIIRVLLKKLSRRELSVAVQEGEAEEILDLSPRAERRYKKAIEDIKKGRNIYKPKNREEFFKMLRS